MRVAPLIKNHQGSAFLQGLEDLGKVFGVTTIAVPLQHLSQNSSNCGEFLKKSLSTRTHKCLICGFVLDTEGNADLKILQGIGCTGGPMVKVQWIWRHRPSASVGTSRKVSPGAESGKLSAEAGNSSGFRAQRRLTFGLGISLSYLQID
nr:zinc ribbon domain-containing protein [Oscillatoria acuminata]